MKHQTTFWWSCPACLKEQQREFEELLQKSEIQHADFVRVMKILRKQLKIVERRESA